MQAQKTLSHAVRTHMKRSGHNYEQLAQQWSVSKTTVYRAAKGDWKISTGHVEMIARNLNIDLYPKNDITKCEILIKTLEEVWDGTPTHAIVLARVIKGIHQMSLHHKL